MLHLTDIFFISVGAFSVRPSLVHPTCDERNEQCVYVSTGIMLLTRVLCTRDLQILNGTGDVLVPVDTHVHACTSIELEMRMCKNDVYRRILHVRALSHIHMRRYIYISIHTRVNK